MYPRIKYSFPLLTFQPNKPADVPALLASAKVQPPPPVSQTYRFSTVPFPPNAIVSPKYSPSAVNDVVGLVLKKYSALVPTSSLPLITKVVPSNVKFGSESAELDVPFAVNTLLLVVGEIEVNPAPCAP